MMKTKFVWLFLVAMAGTVGAGAQEKIEVADTVSIDEIRDLAEDDGKEATPITQHPLGECDWVEICENPKYAIVTKDGRQGIYDMEFHKNITEIEYKLVGYTSQHFLDSITVSTFYAKQGIKHGIMEVFENDNSILSLWADDPEEVYRLDDCTTIDKKIMKRTKKLLKQYIQQQQVENAQILILDAQSGRLKTWVAVDADMTKENAGKLLAHSCSASLTIPFRNGTPPKNRKLNATSPLVIASGYNSLVHAGKIIIPTLKEDSADVDTIFTETQIAQLQEKLKVNRANTPDLSWLADDIDWWGYGSVDDIVVQNGKEGSTPIGKQIQFAGVFPVDNPRYTICVVVEKQSSEVTTSALQDLVNPLTKWLLKR